MTAGTLIVAAGRWLELAGTLSFIGVVTIRIAAARPAVLAWARAPMHHALALALAGGIATLVAGELATGRVASEVAVRAAVEAVALALCLTIGRGTLPAAGVAILLLPLSSHATRVHPAFPAYFVDLVHVLAAGLWAGGIAVLAFLRPPGGWRGADGRELLRRFGGVALIAFAVTGLTGLVQAAEYLNGVSDLWTTSYGAVLLAKCAAVVAMLALSAVTWRRGAPTARAEAAVAVAVVAASAALVAFPNPPGQA